jgi:hypothetical protein
MFQGMVRVVGAALEPSGFSLCVSQRELCELEIEFKVSLRGSYRCLKVGFRNSNYFVYNLPGRLVYPLR